MLFAAIGMAHINHYLLAQARSFQQAAGGVDIRFGVVGLLAAAQNHVAVVIATGLKNGGLPHLGHAHEGMRCLRRLNRIGGYFHATIGAILKAYGAAQAAGQLAVALALGGARPNGAPAHQIADELRAQQIQKLGAHRHINGQDVQQQLARHPQTLVDGKAAIQVRVVDIALPAHGGARLFKVHAHDHQQVILERVSLGLELPGVVHGLLVVMDGARPHHHNEPVI